MLFRLYYSLRNLLFYRNPRDVPPEPFIRRVESCMQDPQALRANPQSMADIITAHLFACMGLRIALPDEEPIPPGIYLTRQQRGLIRAAAEHGYRATLR